MDLQRQEGEGIFQWATRLAPAIREMNDVQQLNTLCDLMMEAYNVGAREYRSNFNKEYADRKRWRRITELYYRAPVMPVTKDGLHVECKGFKEGENVRVLLVNEEVFRAKNTGGRGGARPGSGRKKKAGTIDNCEL
ncbi:MAG: hypothetical protein IKQ12_07220 [Prevotella sp.]|nr:hypothetical protein [Prevotella sp.]